MVSFWRNFHHRLPNDNFKCNQWWKLHQNDGIFVSVRQCWTAASMNSTHTIHAGQVMYAFLGTLRNGDVIIVRRQFTYVTSSPIGWWFLKCSMSQPVKEAVTQKRPVSLEWSVMLHCLRVFGHWHDISHYSNRPRDQPFYDKDSVTKHIPSHTFTLIFSWSCVYQRQVFSVWIGN